MANTQQITVIGNLTGDPELRFTQSGAAVVNFTVAHTPRMFDKQSNAWKDGESIFWNCALWRDAAENAAESLSKGMRVIVAGEVVNESWESNGEKRSRLKIQVDEVGPSLKYATAKVERKAKSGGAAATASGSWGAASDPWAAEPASDEVPF